MDEQKETTRALPGQPIDGRGPAPVPPAALLATLNPNTDIARLVERVVRDSLTWVVVPSAALTAWEQRDPVGWATVSAWLAARAVTVVRI